MSGFAQRAALRLRWPWLVGTLAIAGLSVVAGATDVWWSDDAFASVEGDGRRSQAYLLEDGDLRFEIPTRALELRILTTALLDPGELEQSDDWQYGIDLDFPEGRRKQFFRSRATLFQTPEGERRYALSLLGPADARGRVPLDSRTARFKRTPGTEPFTLTVERSPGTEAGGEEGTLAVRVYFKERVPEHRRGAVWPRLSERERRQRAVGNVYPPELLTESERAELMSFRWSALAPNGVEGDDYERLVLFQHADPGRPVADEGSQSASGLRLPAGLRYRLAPFRGRLVARALSPAGGALLEGRGLSAEQGPGGLETYAVDATSPLDLVATTDVALTAQPDEGEVDLRAEALRLYGCATPLDYELVHGAEATPLRLDLRTVGAVDSEATVELLSDDGLVISRQLVEVASSMSSLDWLDEPGTPRRVSEAFRRYVATSTATARLRLTGCTDALRVAVYNRPGERPAERSAPARDGDIKDWWVLLPQDKEHQTSSLLRLQPRDDGAASTPAPERTLRDLRPTGEDGRYVLLPMEQSNAPGYAPLRRGPQRIAIATVDGRRSVQPRLLYRRTQRSPFRLALEVDGQILLDEELAGRQGEVVLPAITSGSHSVELTFGREIDASGVDVYLGNVAPTPGGQRFARRLTFRAPPSFLVDWSHDGSRTAISGRLYTEDRLGACRLEATLGGARRSVGAPSSSYTFARRRWTLGDSTEIAALGSDTLTLRRSAPFFFLLGEDVEAGSLSVRYKVSCPGEVFLTLAVLDDPPQEVVRVWRERDL